MADPETTPADTGQASYGNSGETPGGNGDAGATPAGDPDPTNTHHTDTGIGKPDGETPARGGEAGGDPGS